LGFNLQRHVSPSVVRAVAVELVLELFTDKKEKTAELAVFILKSQPLSGYYIISCIFRQFTCLYVHFVRKVSIKREKICFYLFFHVD